MGDRCVLIIYITDALPVPIGQWPYREGASIMYKNNKQLTLITSFPDDGKRQGL
jgi:hypothetical protein